MLGATKDPTVRICMPTPDFPGWVKLPESEIKPTQRGQSCLRPLERGGWDRRKGKGDGGRKAQGRGQLRVRHFQKPITNTATCLSPF